MKRGCIATVITVICVIALIIVVIVISFAIRCNVVPTGKFTLDEHISDNSYNNTNLSSGELVMLNDKLYYNFYGGDSEYQYGTYEIESTGSRRVQWGGPSIKVPYLDRFEPYKGNLLMDEITVTGSIHRFNPDTGSQEGFINLKDAEQNEYRTFDIIDGRMYIFSDEKIFVSDDAVNTKLVFDNLEDIAERSEKLLYIKDDFLTYVSKDEHIKKYNFKTKKYVLNKKLILDELVIDYGESGGLLDYINILFVAEDKIMLNCGDEEKQIIYNITDNCKVVYSCDYKSSGRNPNDYVNVYKNKIFLLNTDDGVDVVDVDTSKMCNVVKSGVEEVYIFGDKWIYYIADKGGTLYRTTMDGKTTEKIFG